MLAARRGPPLSLQSHTFTGQVVIKSKSTYAKAADCLQCELLFHLCGLFCLKTKTASYFCGQKH